MYVFELQFTLPSDAETTLHEWSPFRSAIRSLTGVNAAEEAIGILLTEWQINGQVLGDASPVARVDGGFRVFVRVPARDALSEPHHSESARTCLRQFTPAELGTMQVRPIGREPRSASECPGHPEAELVLYADVYREESPLRCAECFGPVPLYTIAVGNESRRAIVWWDSGYRSCDHLEMRKGAAAAFAQHEMQSPESDLSREGLELCARIAGATGRRTWYFLARQRGVGRAAARERRCPRCGGEWLLSERWHRTFDFRCERCALVSRLPWPYEYEDEDDGPADADGAAEA
ncbi:MAG TPA: DUF2310 family Zn-ribbon-containing protein [Longimicrobium sp.]|jgi:predicted  nucleic acid-binding Zn ribbon protein